MRADRRMAAFCVALSACGTAARLTRPEGDGGWSPPRRSAEVERRVVDAAGPSVASGPLTLADALALAERGNQRIAAAEHDVAGARERVWEARGRLLPATTGSGRYTWYTAAQTTQVHLPAQILRTSLPLPVETIR